MKLKKMSALDLRHDKKIENISDEHFSFILLYLITLRLLTSLRISV